jgi:hypothetical protein
MGIGAELSVVSCQWSVAFEQLTTHNGPLTTDNLQTMQHIGSILASADDSIAKVVIGVIVFIFWGLGSIASALKKSAEKNQQRRMASELPIELTPRMEVAAARPVPARPPAQRPAQGRARMIAAPVAAPAPRRVAAAPLAPPVLAPARATSPKSQPIGTISPVMPRPVSPAGQLAKSLRPESLRTQWLLTEILAKPLALRETDALGPR